MYVVHESCRQARTCVFCMCMDGMYNLVIDAITEKKEYYERCMIGGDEIESDGSTVKTLS